MKASQFWRRLTTTPYARTLEAELALERSVVARLDAVIAHQGREAAQGAGEVARQGAEIIRLRAENRALLNSILGIAGVPPVPASLDDLAALQNEIGGDSFRTAGTSSDAPYGARPAPLPLGLPETEMLEQQQNLNSETPAAPGQDAGTKARRYEHPGTGPTHGALHAAARTANHSRSRANQTPHVAAPTRRRSWPQIHRRLEFDSAQKEKPDADPLPPAHQ